MVDSEDSREELFAHTAEHRLQLILIDRLIVVAISEGRDAPFSANALESLPTSIDQHAANTELLVVMDEILTRIMVKTK
jgi:hypothetical protein